MATLPNFIAGAVFGSALLASGVYSPSVIVSQMRLENFHMLKSFLAASACSAGIVYIADASDYAPCRTRSPAQYGWFPYDANIIGGLAIGAGMALTGACPGTVLTQLATGIRSGFFVGIGALLGGILFTGFAPRLRRQNFLPTPPPSASASASAATGSASGVDTPAPPVTIQALLKTTTSRVLLSYEALLALAILAAQSLAPQAPHWLDPITGGLLIGAAQALTVLLTRRTVGVSTAYHDVGRRLWRSVSSISSPSSPAFPTASLLTPATTFALGILAGSCALARSGALPPGALAAAAATGPAVTDLSASVGGAAMAFGAGLAGGCPSGHGISGMATFSTASFVSVAGMFGGGIAVARTVGMGGG